MNNQSIATKGLLRQIASVFRGEGKDIAVIFIYAAVVGLCTLAVPIAVQSLVSSVALASILQPVVVLTVFVAGVLSFSGLIRIFQLWAAELIQRRLMVRCSLALAQKLPQVSVREFARSYGPEYVVRYMELFAVQKLATMIMLDGSAVFFQILVGLVLVSFYHPFFLVFAFLLLCSIAFLVFVLGIGGVETSQAESDSKYAMMAWLQSLSRHPETFKSVQGERYAVERMDKLVAGYLIDRSSHFAVLMRQHIGAAVLQAFASALLLGLGGWLVIRGQLTLGQLVAAELVFGLVLTGVTKLGRHLEKFYDLTASVSKLDSLFDLPYEEPSGSYFGVEKGGAALAIKQVTIHSAQFSTPLLEKIDFQLKPGEKAVLWGPNASGKSLLADIIYRSADAYSGRVEIDSHPVSAIHPRELRSEVAIIRGVEIFPGTIEENLLLGRKKLSGQELRQVLDLVGLSESIYSLRDGINTLITGSSQLFSSGESLRLMVARGLLASPRLLLVDGTLDSMDKSSQEKILDLIINYLPDLTVLLFTHEHGLASTLPRSLAVFNNTVVEKSIGDKK